MEFLERQAQLREREIVNKVDITKVTKLIPLFDEYDPDFFLQFEGVAIRLSWPGDYWSLLVQSIIKGKARSTYVAMSHEQQKKYELGK